MKMKTMKLKCKRCKEECLVFTNIPKGKQRPIYCNDCELNYITIKQLVKMFFRNTNQPNKKLVFRPERKKDFEKLLLGGRKK